MSKKQTSRSTFGIGMSSILIIFVLLCLVVFAMLSLVTANADWNLENRLVSRTTSYYDACTKADNLLEEIDRRLEQLYAESPEDYDGSVLSYLAELSGQTEEDEEEIRFSFVETINDDQYLAVTVSIPRIPVPGCHYYQILSWTSVSNQTWEPDEGLNVLE